MDELLGTFPSDPETVAKCGELAYEEGYGAFSVQYGGKCWSSALALYDYDFLGQSQECNKPQRSNIIGMQVYRLPARKYMKSLHSPRYNR